MTDLEIETAVFEAGRAGVPVAAHAYGGSGIDSAVDAGVRSIEHGIFLTEEQVDEAVNFMTDNIEVEILLFEDKPIGLSLPNFVELVVTEAEPWAKGDTVSGATKPVKVQTGYTILVPTFISEGEKIRIDTRTGEYLTRVKG